MWLRVEDMDACDIEQARRRGDGVLEGVGSVGGEAEVAERGEQGGGGERKAEGEAPIRSHGEKDKGRDNFVYLLLDMWQAEAA